MTCTKTDFRMYQPFMGQPEEICWTCGVAKEKHAPSKPEGIYSGVRLTMDVLQNAVNLTARRGYSTPPSGLAAWLPSSPATVPCVDFRNVIQNASHQPSSPHHLLVTCMVHRSQAFGINHITIPSAVNFTVPIANIKWEFPPSIWLRAKDYTKGPVDIYGVDITLDQVRLGGIFIDRSGSPIEDAIHDGLQLAAREGAIPDVGFISEKNYLKLQNNLGSKVTYGTTYPVDTIRVNGPYGSIDFLPTNNVTNDFVYLCTKDTWRWDINFGGFCTAPGQNVRIKI